jgi:prophage regulatory protein
MAGQTKDTLTSNVSNMKFTGLPETGFLRLKQIIGDKKANPPVPALLPVSAATFWAKIKNDEWALKPIKLSANVTAFRVEEVRTLIESFSQGAAA